MRNKALLLFSLLAFLSPSLSAQQGTPRSKVNYFFSLQTGGAFGKKRQGASLTNSLIQGIRYQRFTFGAGVGYDAYDDWQTVPFFASAGFDLLRRHGNAVYLQMNGGYAKAWNPSFNANQFVFYEDGNLYLHPLFGYRITSGKLNIYLSAGYKFQRLRYGWTWGWGVPASETRIERTIERISLQLGVGFG